MSNSINYFRSFPIKVNTRNEWTLFSELVFCFSTFFLLSTRFCFHISVRLLRQVPTLSTIYFLANFNLFFDSFFSSPFPCLSVCLFVRCPFARVSICLPVHLSACRFVFLSSCPFVRLSICMYCIVCFLHLYWSYPPGLNKIPKTQKTQKSEKNKNENRTEK